ncbi:allatostatin-A receptor-like [Tubulanus polymorphus]|uniref:allatostatin-A receptor-like n=1 Tax=Tubulanus polymorphus TaxID=672921 RepID=UPI003DA6B941
MEYYSIGNSSDPGVDGSGKSTEIWRMAPMTPIMRNDTNNLSIVMSPNSTTCDQFLNAEAVIAAVEYYVPPIVLTIGLIGNTLSFFVMIRPWNRRNSTCFFMAALAIADNLVLLCWLLQWLLDYYIGAILTTWLCKSRKYLVMTMFRISAWIIVAMTIDKAIAVNFPIKSTRICTSKYAKIEVIVLTILLLVTNAQYLVISDIVFFQATGKRQCVFVHATPSALQIINLTGLLSGTILPICFIVIANLCIVFGINRARKRGMNLGLRRPSRVHEARMTRSLLLVSCAFLLFVSPFRILILVKDEMTLTKCTTNAEIMAILSAIFRSFLFVNSAVNFILYCIGGGTKFRLELRDILRLPLGGGKRKSGRNGGHLPGQRTLSASSVSTSITRTRSPTTTSLV